jgi:hypothetical protein
MFDVIPYWMWAASLLVLALVCGVALSAHESRHALTRVRGVSARAKWRVR